MGEVVEVECLRAEHFKLQPGFHDQASQSFSLSQANAGEFQAELVAVDPPHNGLIDAERPLKIRKKQRQFPYHPNCHVDR